MLVVVLAYHASGLGDSHRWWASGVAIVLGVLLADGLADIRVLLPMPGLAPLTIVGALFAISLCVPETDQLPIVAILPMALVVLEVVDRRQLPIEWYIVAAAAVGWGGMFGATGRQSALAGALFAWWTVLLPSFAFVTYRSEHRWRIIGVAGVAALAAVVMARTGGIADRNAELFIALIGCIVVSLAAATALAGKHP